MTASTSASSVFVRPFTVAIADSETDDLKQRLARTRWPDPETVGDWSHGVRVGNARSLVDHCALGAMRPEVLLGKRTTGFEPATSGLGSRRSTN